MLQHSDGVDDVTGNLPPPSSGAVTEKTPQHGLDSLVQAFNEPICSQVRSDYEPVLHPIASQIPIKLFSVFWTLVTVHHLWECIPAGDLLVKPASGLM